MSTTIPLSDGDLHGLVDGRLEASRRGTVLRRLAASPADRAKVESWQDQNDLIRNAFLGIDTEPLPASLKLTPPPNLQSVPSADNVQDEASLRQRRRMTSLATLLLVAIGTGGIWMVMQASDDPSSQFVHLRSAVDEALAVRATGALDTEPGVSTQARAISNPPASAPPTTTIPDLSSTGFTFTSAETPASLPNALIFHYRNASADRIAVSVARAPAVPDTGPTRIGRSFSWHSGDKAFAIAGTVQPAKLRAMATMLQDGGGN